ncbi:hydrocephalus-inducing protein homolog [Linepithema humile]|uniref:hydrocephalus-inducing protein homolog n=1 Tax=Linepithema humile TaxID=83485 RepID=UPI00351DBB6A
MYSEEENLQQTDEIVVTNKSHLNLNVLLYIDAPFYLINDKKKLVHKKKIILLIDISTTILVKFSPNINLNDPYSRNYGGALWFEYDEHPNKNKIQCKGVVNFPNITFFSKDLIINCVSGSSAEQALRMTNNGPIPVKYKFLWAGESIEIQRREFTDPSKLQINAENYKIYPHSYENKRNLELHENKDGKTAVLPISLSYGICYSISCNFNKKYSFIINNDLKVK